LQQAPEASSFTPARDLPNVLGHWDASVLTAADGTAINTIPDLSGYGQDMVQWGTASQGTMATRNGRRVVHIGTSAWYGFTGWATRFGSANLPQPYTVIGVMAAAATSPGTLRNIMGAGSTAVSELILDNSGYTATIQSGAAAVGNGGQPLNDNNMHVFAAVFDTNSAQVYVDGQLVSAAPSQAHGTNPITDLYWGCRVAGSGGWNGDAGELIVTSGRLTTAQIYKASVGLAAKWGITLNGRMDRPVVKLNSTSANGQNVLVALPAATQRPATGVPLIIWSHPHAATEALTPNYFAWPLLAACVNEGWAFAASRMHSDSWGNQNALDDNLDLYNKVVSLTPVSKVIMVGGSMGGVPSSLSIADGRIPNIKGVIGVDAVFSLASIYTNSSYTTSIDTAYGITRGTLSGATTAGATSIPTTASFPTIGTQLLIGNGTANVETVTTTGASNGTSVAVTATVNAHASAEQVSDYSTKTAGHDPMLKTGASYGTTPFRFYAGATDSTVPVASHATPLATLLTGATEKVINTHVLGHLDPHSIWPADLVPFIKRCLV